MNHKSSVSRLAAFKPAQESFLHHPSLYDQLFHRHPLPKFIISAESLRFLQVNESAVRHIGYGTKELLHLALTDISPEADINRIKQDVAQTTTDGCMRECTLRHKDGATIFMELFSLPFDFQNQKAWLITLTDITARKQAEQELEASKLRYEMFIRQSNEAMWRFELTEPVSIHLPEAELIRLFEERFYLAECNDVMAKMYGREKAEDIIGLTITQMLPPGDPATTAFYTTCIQSRFNVRDLVSHEVDLNGQQKVFSNSYVGIVEDDHLLRVWGTQRDITEQWQAQQQEKLLAGMIGNAPDPIYSVTPDRIILTWNKACEELTGVPGSAIIGHRSSDFFKYAYTAVDGEATILETLAQCGSWKGEVVLELSQRNEIINLLVTLKAVKSEAGVISRIIVFCKNITDRKQAERELAQQAERLTSIFESITDGFLAIDNEFTVTMWNNGAEKIFGIRPDDIIGKPAYVNFKSYKNTPGAAILNDALLQKKSAQFEEFVTATGLWSECKVYPHPGGFFLYFKDVTSRKRNELLLRLQMQLLERSANQNASVKDIADTLTTGIEEIFPGTAGALYLPDETSGKIQVLSAPSLSGSSCNDDNCCLPATHTCVVHGVLKNLSTALAPTSSRWQHHNIAAEIGAWKTMCTFPVLSSQQCVLAVLSTYHKEEYAAGTDELEAVQRLACLLAVILEKRMMEENMQLANQRYELVKKATNEAIWETDFATGFITWGEGFSRIFGHNKARIHRRDFWHTLIHPQDRKKVATAFFHITGAKKIYTAEYRLQRGDGSFAHVHDTGHLICDEVGTPVRMAGSIRDITEQKNLEQRLLEEELSKQRLVKEAILEGSERQRAEISRELHDNVNQILSSAKLYLSMAQQQEQVQSALVAHSIEFIDTSINEIRKLSHSLAPPCLQHLGLRESIEALIHDIHRVHTLRISYQAPAGIEEALSEDLKLSLFRMVQEQLNNCLKYAHASQVTIALHLDADMVRMEITDNGIGFDPKQVQKGLGLANMANRADLFNGTAQVEAAPGAGCKITITIPFPEN